MPSENPTYDELISRIRQVSLLHSCAEVLGWDEQTYLPERGTEHRANQLSLLSGMAHEQMTSPRIGELLDTLESSGDLGASDSPVAVNVRETRFKYKRATKLPRALVEEISRATSMAREAWVAARAKSDFAAFLPWLDKIVSLKREEADAVGYAGQARYDALLDEYEPGANSAEIAAVFAPLRDELVKLVSAITQSGKPADESILHRHYPKQAQQLFAADAARSIGFDFSRGRIDEAAHPFCSGFGPGDCRLTTRYDEKFFSSAFFGVLHEAGHGIYEQGLNEQAFGTPMGDAVSLGVHESQSRLWENRVGRSRELWSYLFPKAQQAFSDALADVRLEDFYRAINVVRPSYIRVEADEVTYNLHIMMRFELEQQLIGGELSPADVPAAWNESFTKYFGITPPNDAQGCLQDVHWSAGLIGYFPTYALGNMYAAQFFEAAQEAIGDPDAQFSKGECGPLKAWLNEHIHRRGKQYRACDLVQVVTGRPLSHEPLVRQLNEKFGELYGLN